MMNEGHRETAKTSLVPFHSFIQEILYLLKTSKQAEDAH